jgi:predicted metalloprotease with PDZ domain
MMTKKTSSFLLRTFVLSLALTFMFKTATAETPTETTGRQAVPEISYTVSMSKPWTHLLEVEMRVRWSAMPQDLDLKMPVWTPGSYLVREYSRHVQDFAAKDDAGNTLAWEKTSKNTWRIKGAKGREVVATYRVYSNELTVRTNELNDEHAFWNNSALLFFPAGQLKAPSKIKVIPYGNWKVATGLRPVAGEANTFTAPDYDILYDSPFQVSDFKEKTFQVAGRPHRIVVTGEGNYDLDQMAEDTAKIGEAGIAIFGELPIDDYLIILNLRGRGGLEHLNSTALQWNRFGFQPRSQYINYLRLVAHEYFHLWNVKRIRPDVLGPFDYENENYTKLLWVAEGTTAYYEDVLLRRAGLITPEENLEAKASMIGDLQNRPGRFQTSLEESSFDAWIKYYRQDENSVNNQISYYDKGEIVNMLLDIEIRNASGHQRSLDTVMRVLYEDFYKRGRNFTPAGFQRACEAAAGRSLSDFFTKYISGRDEIQYNSILQGIGLRLQAGVPSGRPAYIGANLAETDGRLTVRSVPAGTPAHEQGLNFNDQIVAIDGHRASNSFLQSYIGEKKPGDKVRMTIFRHDRLRDIEFTLGVNERTVYRFIKEPQPTAEQRAGYERYFGVPIDR